MVFSSIPFLYYFLPAVLAVYFVCPKRGRNAALLAFSLFFYGYGEPKFLLLMGAAIIQGYVFGILTDRQQDKKTPQICRGDVGRNFSGNSGLF